MTSFLSFSGGGWNTFSNIAGAITGGLDELEDSGTERNIDNLLESYNYISGNSGGTWFLTALGFSDDFRDTLEDRITADDYNTNGFNARVKEVFDGYNSSHTNLFRYSTDKEVSFLNLMSSFGFNWGDFVKSSVYDPISDYSLSSKSFSSGNLALWTAGKHLSYATGLASGSSLNADGQLEATSPPIVSRLAWDQTKGFSGINQVYTNESNFAPLSIEIEPSGLSRYRLIDTYDQEHLKIEFTHNGSSSNQTPPVNDSYLREGDSSSLNVLDPSIASSAAVAASAFPSAVRNMIGNFKIPGFGSTDNQIAYFLRSLAPISTFSNADTFQANHYYPSGVIGIGHEYSPGLFSKFDTNWQHINEKGYIRTVDGGYLDNTSLAYNLSAAAAKGELVDGFEATLYHNSTESIDGLITINGESGTNALIPEDLAALFGLDDYERKTGSTGEVYQNRESELWSLPPQIFGTDSLTGENLEPVWKYDASISDPSNDIQLRYWEVDVETKENKDYGIPGGIEGSVRIFSSLNPSSDAIPYMESIHEDYKDNFNTWREAIGTAPESISFF